MKRILLVLCMLAMGLSVAFAQSRVSGTVTDEEGAPVEGAAVLLKGTTVGVFTNSEGKFSINVPEGDNTLLFSFVGKLTSEELVDGRNSINVTLENDYLELDEVVVTGYGSQSKRSLTGSIARVDAKDVNNVPVTNFEQAVQGRVAGVTISTNSGTLGAAINVNIRGVSSINGSNQPLYVIDGIPVEGAAGAALGGPGTNPLININPNDIASVEILKDASASAIFGARATNGVILITTKRGEAGKPKVSINYFAGSVTPTRTFDLLTGNEYAQMWNQAGEGRANLQGLGRDAWYTDDYQLGTFGTNRLLTEGEQPDAMWQDQILQSAVLQEVSASVSGKTGGTSFYLSGTYRDQDGFTRTTNLRRYTFRANIDQRVNKWLKVGLNVSPSRSVNFRQNEDNNVASPWTYAVLASPVVEATDADGNPIFDDGENGYGQVFNGTPLTNLLGQDQTLIVDQTLTSVYGEVQLMDGLTFRTELGLETAGNFETTKRGSMTTDGFPIGTGSAESEQVTNYNVNSFFNYRKTFGLSGLDITLGTQFQRYDFRDAFVSGNTFADDRLLTLSSAAEITGGGGAGTNYSFQNNFLRANYNFDNKYLLSVTASYNGSSRFGADTRYGFFPAVSAGWVISNESFLANNNTINFLKVRGSFGLTGNAEIGNFASRGLAAFGRDYGAVPGYQVSQLANNLLTWENASQLDVAIEYGLFNNRAKGTLGYFNKTSNDLLFDVPLPWTTGFGAITSNIGSVRNQGIEFDLEVDIIRTRDFNWSIGGNISSIQNEVVRMPDNDGDGNPDITINGRQIIREGQPLGAFYMVSYAGVDPENGNALFNTVETPADGETVFQGDEVLSDSSSSSYSNANRSIVGSPFPDYFGGFFTNLNYKGLELSVLFQYSVGNDLYRNEGRFLANNFSARWNQDRSILNAWTPDNTETDIPEARLFVTNGSQHSTRYLEDASFLRLRNVRLSYTLPKSVLKNQTVTVYFQGQNLLTFTNYEGVDPEANGDAVGNAVRGEVFFSRPQARVLTGGVTLGL